MSRCSAVHQEMAMQTTNSQCVRRVGRSQTRIGRCSGMRSRILAGQPKKTGPARWGAAGPRRKELSGYLLLALREAQPHHRALRDLLAIAFDRLETPAANRADRRVVEHVGRARVAHFDVLDRAGRRYGEGQLDPAL